MASKKVTSKVESLLTANKTYRDSDKRLLLAFWASEGLQLTDFQKTMFMQCTPAGSITRARRRLRSQYPGAKAVEEMRFKKMEEEQDRHSNFFLRRFRGLVK